MGQVQSQKISTKIRISFLTSGTERISLSFSVKEHKNMDPLDGTCLDNLSFATNISVLQSFHFQVIVWCKCICFRCNTDFWPPPFFYKEQIA